MNELEKECIRSLAKSAGADPEAALSHCDEALSFRENKRVIKDWLKGDGKMVDLRTEIVQEKVLDEAIAKKIEAELQEKEAMAYSEIVTEKESVIKGMDSAFNEVTKEIEAYNPHCSSITYATIFAAMNGRVGQQKTHVINKGKAGIGKSRGTSELVRILGLPDAVILSGYMTPKKMFEILKKHRTSMIVFDESEMIMNNPQALFVLRSALYGGQVSWLSSKGETLDSFNFTGTIIANMNHFGISEHESAPLFDRTLFNQQNLDNRQIMEKMESTQTYKVDKPIWELVRKRVILARTDGLADLEPAEEETVMQNIRELTSNSSVFSKSLSTRTVWKAKLVARCMKTLFGSLRPDVWEAAKRIMKPYISTDDAEDICVKLLKKNPDLSRLEITELIAEEKGISSRQASRMIKAAIDRGVLVAKNRTSLGLPEVK